MNADQSTQATGTMIYHVQLDESTRLPMKADAVREAWKRGRVRPDTLVWREGLNEWTTAHALREELQLPERLGGFAPVPTSYVARETERAAEAAKAAAAIKSEPLIIGALLVLVGAGVLAFFLCVYDVRVMNLATGISMESAEKLQNRVFGTVAGAVLAIFGGVMIWRSEE